MAKKINKAWHQAHPMPQKASLEQRIIWHTQHQKECGCREIPKSVQQAIYGHGTNVAA